MFCQLDLLFYFRIKSVKHCVNLLEIHFISVSFIILQLKRTQSKKFQTHFPKGNPCSIFFSEKGENGPNFQFFPNTGCPVLSDFFQKPLRGTYIPQLLMTNDSFSSQTWAIYVPNRNSDVKSILWPPGPLRVRSQNDGYWQNLSKFIGKIGIFTKC